MRFIVFFISSFILFVDCRPSNCGAENWNECMQEFNINHAASTQDGNTGTNSMDVACPAESLKLYSTVGKIICTRNGRSDVLEDKHKKRKRRVAYYQKKWTKSYDGFVYIPYEYRHGIPDDSRRAFEAAVTEIRSKTCVRFVKRKLTDTDYVEVKADDGCSSHVGHQSGRQSLSLAEKCTTLPIALHEALHTMGFHHTMQRKDTKKYIQINKENIRPGFERNFDEHVYLQAVVYGIDFPFHSVMMNGKYDFALDSNKPTIISKQDPHARFGLPNAVTWSTDDITAVNRMYNCRNFSIG